MIRRPPRSTLFPYTTLFRSHIERKPGKVTVTVHTGRPGVVIGKRGAEVDKLRDELAQLTGKEVGINVEEIKRPELDVDPHFLAGQLGDRKSTRLNSSHGYIS